VYRHDPRDRRKQRLATDLLRRGIADGSLRVAHQAVVEFHAYADTNAIPEMVSEGFQHGRLYGRVRVIDPFA
jgi:hypothetical protein